MRASFSPEPPLHPASGAQSSPARGSAPKHHFRNYYEITKTHIVNRLPLNVAPPGWRGLPLPRRVRPAELPLLLLVRLQGARTLEQLLHLLIIPLIHLVRPLGRSGQWRLVWSCLRETETYISNPMELFSMITIKTINVEWITRNTLKLSKNLRRKTHHPDLLSVFDEQRGDAARLRASHLGRRRFLSWTEACNQ